jgi:hypothetical protein
MKGQLLHDAMIVIPSNPSQLLGSRLPSLLPPSGELFKENDTRCDCQRRVTLSIEFDVSPKLKTGLTRFGPVHSVFDFERDNVAVGKVEFTIHALILEAIDPVYP